jgi:hypothetical protein
MEEVLSIVRGTTNPFSVIVKDHAGETQVLSEDQILIFGLKQNELDDNRVLVKPVSKRENGENYLELLPAETMDLEPGTYYYDIGMKQGTSFFNIVESSPIKIKPNVTKITDFREG